MISPFSRAAVLLAAFVACYAPSVTETLKERTPAPVMSTAGVGWLERKEREEEERPDLVIAAMELKPGQIIADVGAGSGYFTRRLSRAVGPEGRVFANEVQADMLDVLRERVAGEGITNVVPILGTPADPRLPAGSIDWVVLVDVYHEFQEPQAMLAGIRQALKPGGRVALVEYRENARQIREEHRMSREQVLHEWEPAGFRLVRIIETLPVQRLFIFEKSE